jgi:predicted nuclease of predicted toxin-antitoxin system
MNLSPDLAARIGAAGHEVIHWSTVGDHRATDATILSWVQANGWILVTHDLDFGAILATSGAAGPSVIRIRQQDLLSEAIVRTVVATVEIAAPALASAAVVTIHEDSSRIRVLPLRRSLHAD